MRKDIINSPRLTELKKNRRIAVWGKVFKFFLYFLAISLFLIYASQLKSLNIQEIQVSGNKVIDTESIQETTNEIIAGKYLWLFPKTNILFYPETKIVNALQDKFKRLTDIELSIKGNKILEISVAERAPKYMWCGEEVGSASKCYFTDETGYIFDEAPYFSGDVYFKFYGLAGVDVNNPSGSYFFNQNFSSLIYLRDALVEMNLRPTKIYVSKEGDIEVILSAGSLKTEPKIILSSQSDFQNVVENLDAALSTDPLQSKIKSYYSSLQYIDLRYGNKVYYKFSN